MLKTVFVLLITSFTMPVSGGAGVIVGSAICAGPLATCMTGCVAAALAPPVFAGCEAVCLTAWATCEGVSWLTIPFHLCFSEKNKVVTPTGFREVIDLKKGDYVSTLDAQTLQPTFTKVTNITVIEGDHVFRKFMFANSNSLEVTPQHMMIVGNSWESTVVKPAHEVVVGDYMHSKGVKSQVVKIATSVVRGGTKVDIRTDSGSILVENVFTTAHCHVMEDGYRSRTWKENLERYAVTHKGFFDEDVMNYELN